MPSAVLSPDAWLAEARTALTTETAADAGTVLAALAGGVAFDIGLGSGVASVGGALAVAVVLAAVVWRGRVTNPQARGALMLAALFGSFLVARTSPWLVPLDALTCGALVVAGASWARGGSMLDLAPSELVVRILHAGAHALGAPRFLRGALLLEGGGLSGSHRRSTIVAIGRGVGIALPVVAVLAALLSASDPVFASFFHLHVHLAGAARHAVWVGFGTLGLGAVLRMCAGAAPPAAPMGVRLPLGRVEAVVVLGALDALFGLFALAQIVGMSGGGRHVLTTAGLTYAQYARSGFFQLVAVAVITLLVLGVLRATAGDALPVAAAELAVVLTLAIVAVAVHRLALYERAYGLTMLRLYVEIAALVCGAVFVLLALAVGGVARDRSWLLGAAGGVVVVAVALLNFANPEAIVARHNVAFATSGHRFDPVYLGRLSTDAVTALLAGAAQLDPGARSELVNEVRAQHCHDRTAGWADANWSRARAHHLLAAICTKGP